MTLEQSSNEIPTVSLTRRFFRLLAGNMLLLLGLALLGAIIAFTGFGYLFVDLELARLNSAPISQPPSLEHWFGTDAVGRSILALLVIGTPKTLLIGLLAGVCGITIGTCLGFFAGYVRGWADTVIRIISDVLFVIPILFLLVFIIEYFPVGAVWIMGIVIGVLSWMGTARTVRAQVLTLRERAFVNMARASGAGTWRIIFVELMPNLTSYLAASFVQAVSGGILFSIGLEVLGLGPANSQTLGWSIWWANDYGAVLRGFWWWWGSPVVIIVIIFLGLFLTSLGLDRIANPRLRGTS